MPWLADQPYAGFSTAEPWLPLDPRHAGMAVDREEADPASILHVTRRLIALRKAHPALRLGDLRLLDTQGSVLAFERRLGGERLICAFNLGHAPAPWTAPAGFAVIDSVNLDEAAPATLPALGGAILAERRE
jgi:alpha-glucosidase